MAVGLNTGTANVAKQCDCCKRAFHKDVMFDTGEFCVCPACNAVMVLEFTRKPTRLAAVRSYVKAAHLGEDMVIQTVGVYPLGDGKTKRISPSEYNEFLSKETKEEHNDT